MTPLPSPSARIRDLRTDARTALRQGDLEDARRLALEALDALAALAASEADIVERADLHHSLSALFRDLGDPARCEPLARGALALEATLQRPAILGNHHMFLATFLAAQNRLTEAAQHALEGLSYYERAYAPEHAELAAIRADVTKILHATHDPRMRSR